MASFGPFVLGEGGELRKDGVPVSLQPQPAQVLAYLIASNGRVVSREELIRHVWADGHHVDFRQGLNYCIRQVRVALEDEVSAPRYIETVGRKGYRWIGRAAPPRAEPLRARVPVWGAGVATLMGSALTAVVMMQLAVGQPPSATDWLATVNQLHRWSHVVVDQAAAWFF